MNTYDHNQDPLTETHIDTKWVEHSHAYSRKMGESVKESIEPAVNNPLEYTDIHWEAYNLPHGGLGLDLTGGGIHSPLGGVQ